MLGVCKSIQFVLIKKKGITIYKLKTIEKLHQIKFKIKNYRRLKYNYVVYFNHGLLCN